MFEFPVNDDYSTLVNLEFLKGIWVLCLSIKEVIHNPKFERDPLMQVNS